jgi:hypothetical protein
MPVPSNFPFLEPAPSLGSYGAVSSSSGPTGGSDLYPSGIALSRSNLRTDQRTMDRPSVPCPMWTSSSANRATFF